MKVLPCPSAALTGAVRKRSFVLVVVFLLQIPNSKVAILRGENVIKKKNHYTEEILVQKDSRLNKRATL